MRTFVHTTAFVVAAGLAACSSADKGATADSVAAGAATTTTATGMSADSGMAGMDHSKMSGGMAGMANMTGDPDRDFLRMMSDHHKGLILMTHDAMERKDAPRVAPDAKTMDTKQDAELKKMQGMLQQRYSDRYEAKVMPESQKMADGLKPLAGKEYEKSFLRNVVMHHQQALKMVDAYLPTAKVPELKAMAEKMKADQTKEIAELERKMATL